MIPANVEVMSFFTFLLRDGVRPYQNFVIDDRRVEGIYFEELPRSAEFAPKKAAGRYYLSSDNRIYKDRVSEFVCCCDEVSAGKVLKRVQRIYDRIYIDEFQDLCGYDLEFVERLFRSSANVTVVTDPRQTIYNTHFSSKNKKFKKEHVIDWLNTRQRGLVEVRECTDCYRSNQQICDFADALYPSMAKTVSRNDTQTGHDGIFAVRRQDVIRYVEERRPIVLRYMRTVDTMNLRAVNIGLSKGRTFDRVLIFPTNQWVKYLKSLDIRDAGDRAKLYVAVTRARFSVAFVLDHVSNDPVVKIWPAMQENSIAGPQKARKKGAQPRRRVTHPSHSG